MKNKVPLSFIGPIAPPQWGPAVRNRIMLDTFVRWKINAVPLNTLLWKQRPFGFLLDVVRHVWKSRRVILSVSRNGRLVLLPLLAVLGVFRRIHVAFIPAGGTFAHELQSLPSVLRRLYVSILNRFDLVCVQRNELAEQLQVLGSSKTMVMSNFKVWPLVFPEKKPRDCLQLLYLSRIRPVKGIESLMGALDILDQRGMKFTIDFYGILKKDYEPDFIAMLESRSFAKYCGVLPYSDVIPAISNYDLMIFTTMHTEGFPGVLADAAIAGLPVVATDVPSNREIIENGYNGLLASAGDSSDIAEKIELLIQNGPLRLKMGENNRLRAKEYDVEVVLKKFIARLDELGWWK